MDKIKLIKVPLINRPKKLKIFLQTVYIQVNFF